MKRFYLILSGLMLLHALVQAPGVYAQAGVDDLAVNPKNKIFLPIVISVTTDSSSLETPSAEEVAAETQRKYEIVPITEEWMNAREHWFSQEMNNLTTTVQASQSTELSLETLEEMLDQTSAPSSSELATFFANQPVQAAGGVGDGRNDIDISRSQDGDILLGYAPGGQIWGITIPISAWGFWRHTAIWRDRQIIHAPGTGAKVKVDTGTYFRNGYDLATVLRVRVSDAVRKAAATYASNQLGDAYDWWAPKWTDDKWYCSKLPWAGYYWNTPWYWRTDIDSNGGYWVTPDNIWSSRSTYIISYSW